MAESFGTNAPLYDRARPRYPDALVVRVMSGSPGTDLLDIGCGTGIAARQFQAAGCRVLGVEPDARMAEHARTTGVPVEVATFERWEADGRTFDTAIAAQSWHWIDPLAGTAKAATALRPGVGLPSSGTCYSRAEWLDLLPTTGGLTQLHSAQLSEVLDAVGNAIDSLGGRFTMLYTTLATSAVRAQ